MSEPAPSFCLKVSPMTGGGETRIAVATEGYRKEFPQLMRQLGGALWSPKRRCWHFPYTPEHWQRFKELFSGTPILIDRQAAASGDIGTTATAGKPTEIGHAPGADKPDSTPQHPTQERILLLQHATRLDIMGIDLPPSLVATHLQVVKNIPGRKWNAAAFLWEVPLNKRTLAFIERYLMALSDWRFDPKSVEWLDVEDGPGPNVDMHRSAHPLARHEQAVVALDECLTMKRYSHRTVKAYKNAFRQFIKHFDERKPSQLTRKDINDYVVHCIKERKYSESAQSQLLSAIKMFYVEVVKQPEKVEGLWTPKKPQRLPTVFTEEEVASLLKATENPKHKCILMVIYSGGLRLGEVINLRLR